MEIRGKEVLNGLDLFSGIGGLSVALREWVRPIAYCEIDPYCQGVLLSRMASGNIRTAPIWDDVTSLDGSEFESEIDVIYAGFPCQDISVAGNRKGLAGERSGLFFEIIRLAKEIEPKFLFLENTKGILSKGGVEVIETLASIGYSSRWITKSCKEVGSPQNRERWFCLAYSKHSGLPSSSTLESIKETIRDNKEGEKKTCKSSRSNSQRMLPFYSTLRSQNYWDIEPPICRVDTRISFAMDRIRSLGNSVVPVQAKEAFKELIGLY